jgi:hypothetical protein
MATPTDFAKALLNRLGLPQTQNRIVGLVSFAAAEGGHWFNGAKYNPFNTMLGMPGSRDAVGKVQAYKDWSQGIEATARTMSQGNMSAILNALKSDADPKTFQHAITSTPWCPQSSPGCSDYAASDPYASFKSYGNRQDNTSLVAGPGAGIVGWIKDHPVLTASLLLAAIGGGVYYYRPDLFRQLPVVGRLAARENPVTDRKRRRRRRIPAVIDQTFWVHRKGPDGNFRAGGAYGEMYFKSLASAQTYVRNQVARGEGTNSDYRIST